MATLFFGVTYLYCCLVKNRKLQPIMRNKPSISFGGCGVRYHFYAGVAEYCLEKFDTNDIDILVTSGGSYPGTVLALQQKTSEWSSRDWVKCYKHYTNRALYLWLDSCEFQRDLWRNYLPPDAYKRCSDRLFITITRLGLYGFYEDVVSNYNSNEDLIDAIMGTSHIPGLFSSFQICKGRYAFDGCYSNLKPRLDTAYGTLVVQLFGRGHIDYKNKLSLKKLMSIVPPDECDKYFSEGYEYASCKHEEFVKRGFIVKMN